MNIQERESGVLIATHEPTTPPAPPEHTALNVIRTALANLSDGLDNFTQTTHGVMGPFDIRRVADALVRCYEDPRAYTISDLAQFIDGFVGERKC